MRASTRVDDARFRHAVLDRQPEALKALHARCRRVARRRAPREADDLASDLLLRVLAPTSDGTAYFARFDPERGCLETWLDWQCRHLLGHRKRRERTEQQRRAAGAPEYAAPAALHSVEAQALGNLALSETLTAVIALLERMPEQTRLIVYLHALYRWGFPQIGRQLGMTPDGVRMRYQRALKHLRNELGASKPSTRSD